MKTLFPIPTKHSSDQRGFSGHVVIALLLVVGVIGFAGYTVYQRSNQDTTTGSVVLQPDIPAQIKTKSDLEVTGNAISKSGAKLNTELDTSSLDANIQSLL